MKIKLFTKEILCTIIYKANATQLLVRTSIFLKLILRAAQILPIVVQTIK